MMMKQEESAAEPPETAIIVIVGDSSSPQVHISKQNPNLCLFLPLQPNKAFIILGF